MTCAEDIRATEGLGIEFIGFIFVQSSPRSITFEDATDLRGEAMGVKTVGVFMDMPSEQINKYCTGLKLDFAQLHGDPDIEKCKQINVPVIQAFRGVPDSKTVEKFLEICPYILIDKADGEDLADFDAIAALPNSIRSKLFLAGGLNSENVRKAVDMVHPFAVDCARGIETKLGKKDPKEMRAFLHNLPNI